MQAGATFTADFRPAHDQGSSYANLQTQGDRVRPDDVIAAVAAQQHGVIVRAQLLAAGLSSQRVSRRVSAKLLRPLHRGVYLVGPVTMPLAREMAAVLACGTGAVLSHRSAAVMWGLLDRPRNRSSSNRSSWARSSSDRSLPHRSAPDRSSSDRAPVDVTVAGGDRRKPGINVHRVPSLANDEITMLEGIPITTCARTLIDLARVLPDRDLERACAEAFARQLTNPIALAVLLQRHARRPGVGRLRALLEAGAPARTRSPAEDRFLDLIRKAQLPSPEVNVRVCGHEVDFCWRDALLIVEIDGFAFHSSASKFESDRRRDRDLAAAGFRVIRVTWRQLTQESEAIVARVAQALGQRTAP